MEGDPEDKGDKPEKEPEKTDKSEKKEKKDSENSVWFWWLDAGHVHISQRWEWYITSPQFKNIHMATEVITVDVKLFGTSHMSTPHAQLYMCIYTCDIDILYSIL